MIAGTWHHGDWALRFNYLANLVMISVVIYYRYFPRRK
jgi:hypothetical protein